MPSQILQLNNISFSYDSLSEPIFKSLTVSLNNGWTGIIGANGSGKTTFLKLCVNELKAQKGNVINPHFCVYCEQRTDYCPENIEDFLVNYSKEATILKRVLDIDQELINRWNILSQGEKNEFKLEMRYTGIPPF
jgi:ATPase subunit of ABC transporter with duplicated ATPase domains